jgi:hypothetical protein
MIEAVANWTTAWLVVDRGGSAGGSPAGRAVFGMDEVDGNENLGGGV